MSGPPIRSGQLVFRHEGRRCLTVVARAAWRFDAAGALTPSSARALDDQPTGDLAPYKPRVDVLFDGRACAPQPAVGWSARFAIVRGGRALVDRRLYVYGERRADGSYAPVSEAPLTFERALGGAGSGHNPLGTGTPVVVDAGRPDRPACLSAIPPTFPARAAWLGHARLARGEDGWELSPSFPWGYLQAAAPDLQVDGIEASDVFVLEHLSPLGPQVRFTVPTRAPFVTCAGAPLALRLDTVHVDADASLVSLAWRGVARDAPMDAAVVVEGAEAAVASTQPVDVRQLAAPIAPFLQRVVAAERAPSVRATAPTAHGTAPVDARQLDVPLAPFLVAAARASGGSARTDGTPWAPRPAEVKPNVPDARVEPPPARVEPPPAPRPPPPPPPLPPPPPPETIAERLQRAGASDRAMQLLAKAFTKKPEPPRSTE